MTVRTEVGVGVALRYETPHIVVLTIDCPPSNAFSWESRQSMLRSLDIVEADDDVRAVVITGTGRAFTSGAYLREDQALTDAQLADYIGEFSGMLNRIEALRMPVIAAINGASVGGGLEFALACDIRIASTDAFFVAAGVNVGLIVSFWRLPCVVGLGPAKEIILTGSRYTAEQALRWGLVTEVHEPDALLAAALAKAQRIATRAPLSVEAAKLAVTQAFELDFEQGQALQTTKFIEMFRTEDHQEALRAFFEKREGTYVRR
jgi:enoyl-CoA hydratase